MFCDHYNTGIHPSTKLLQYPTALSINCSNRVTLLSCGLSLVALHVPRTPHCRYPTTKSPPTSLARTSSPLSTCYYMYFPTKQPTTLVCLPLRLSPGLCLFFPSIMIAIRTVTFGVQGDIALVSEVRRFDLQHRIIHHPSSLRYNVTYSAGSLLRTSALAPADCRSPRPASAVSGQACFFIKAGVLV